MRKSSKLHVGDGIRSAHRCRSSEIAARVPRRELLNVRAARCRLCLRDAASDHKLRVSSQADSFPFPCCRCSYLGAGQKARCSICRKPRDSTVRSRWEGGCPAQRCGEN